MTSPSRAFRVLVSDRFDADAYTLLERSPSVTVERAKSVDLSQDDLSTTDALIIRSRTRIDQSLLSRAPNLKAVVTATSGFDHIDLTATRSHSVTAMFTPDANAASAAELTWGLLLAAARKIPRAHAAVLKGDWKRETLLGTQLEGQTIAIIGLGRIGSRMARIAQAFGLTTLACDPYRDDAYFRARGCTRVSLPEAFERATIVTCHVPATRETHHMLNAELLSQAFAQSSRAILFANTSRGSIISEDVLLQALDRHWFAAAALDVFETEPLPISSPLLLKPNVVLSPHIGATTHEAFKAASLAAAEKIITFAERGIASDSLP